MDLKLQDGRHNPGLEQVEQIVEFMERTEGVRSATAVLRGTGVFVAVELLAVDPASAVDRARGLALSSARFAGLGAITSACLKLTME